MLFFAYSSCIFPSCDFSPSTYRYDLSCFMSKAPRKKNSQNYTVSDNQGNIGQHAQMAQFDGTISFQRKTGVGKPHTWWILSRGNHFFRQHSGQVHLRRSVFVSNYVAKIATSNHLIWHRDLKHICDLGCGPSQHVSTCACNVTGSVDSQLQLIPAAAVLSGGHASGAWCSWTMLQLILHSLSVDYRIFMDLWVCAFPGSRIFVAMSWHFAAIQVPDGVAAKTQDLNFPLHS